MDTTVIKQNGIIFTKKNILLGVSFLVGAVGVFFGARYAYRAYKHSRPVPQQLEQSSLPVVVPPEVQRSQLDLLQEKKLKNAKIPSSDDQRERLLQLAGTGTVPVPQQKAVLRVGKEKKTNIKK